MPRLGAGLGQHGDDVLQRLPHLADEIVGLELALPVPADLSADEDELAPRSDAIGIADRFRPAFRLQDLVHFKPPGIL